MAETKQDSPLQETPIAHRSSRARRREKHASIGLNLTAMIDVVFLLLLYFLLATSFALNEEAFELDLPDPVTGQAADPFEIPDPPVTVTVASFGDGRLDYRLTSDHPSLTNLAGFADLAERTRAGRFDRGGYLFAPEQVFVLRSQPDARWEHTVGAFNALIRAEFERVRFVGVNPRGGS